MENKQNQTIHKFGGAIPLLRKYQHHPFWTERRKYSRAEAWIDLLFMARYSEVEEKIFDRGEIIIIKYGQILTSIVTLSYKWRKSRTWIRNFIKTLEQDQSIKIIKMDNRRTILEIVNMLQIRNQLRKSGQQTGQQPEHQENNTKTYNNKDNKIENKVNNNTLVEKITLWAYKRARVKPSCSIESFKKSVILAIDRSGDSAVYKEFSMEENAILFLQNIKSLRLIKNQDSIKNNELTKY